jgi:hypothetical protein
MNSCDWTAWYSGGRVYHSRDVSWEDLPQDELQAVLVYKPTGTPKIVGGCDYYWLDGDTIRTDVVPTRPHRLKRHALVPVVSHEQRVVELGALYPKASIKWGKWQSDEAQAETMRQVQASAAAYRGEGVKWR